MRKVIKRLQKENEKLKREALIRTRERTKKASQEGEGEKKDKKVASDRQIAGVTSDPVAKLASDNERLGRSLRREMERNQLSLKTAQLERDRLENQVQYMYCLLNNTLFCHFYVDLYHTKHVSFTSNVYPSISSPKKCVSFTSPPPSTHS